MVGLGPTLAIASAATDCSSYNCKPTDKPQAVTISCCGSHNFVFGVDRSKFFTSLNSETSITYGFLLNKLSVSSKTEL